MAPGSPLIKWLPRQPARDSFTSLATYAHSPSTQLRIARETRPVKLKALIATPGSSGTAPSKCLNVVVNVATMSGVVTDITPGPGSPFVVGSNIVFQVIDNGEGSNAPPDLISLTLLLWPQPTAALHWVGYLLQPFRSSMVTCRCTNTCCTPMCGAQDRPAHPHVCRA